MVMDTTRRPSADRTGSEPAGISPTRADIVRGVRTHEAFESGSPQPHVLE